MNRSRPVERASLCSFEALQALGGLQPVCVIDCVVLARLHMSALVANGEHGLQAVWLFNTGLPLIPVGQ